jgi:hypothetical protein
VQVLLLAKRKWLLSIELKFIITYMTLGLTFAMKGTAKSVAIPPSNIKGSGY